MNNEQCVFCKIAAGVLPSHKIYETETVMAFLDINPINPGHAMIIPKEHYKDLLDAPEEVVALIAKTARKIAPAILKAVGAEDFNLGVNNGPDAGQAVFHSHWHIMPRFPGDGYEPWKGKPEFTENLPEVAEEIRKLIKS